MPTRRQVAPAATEPAALLRSAAMVSAAAMAASLVSFVNQLVIAMTFGATRHTDAYQVGISLPLMVMGVATGLSTHTLVPSLIQHAQERARFCGVLLLCFAALGLLCAAAGCLCAPAMVGTLAPALAPPEHAEAVAVARASWLSAGAVIAMSHLIAAHNAARRFCLPALAHLPAFLGMILLSLAWGRRFGVVVLAWGMLAGYAVALPMLLRGMKSELAIDRECLAKWPEARRVLLRMPVVLVSMLCFTMHGTVDAVWASRLGQAQLTYLAYGQRLLVAVGNAITLGPATVLLPRLSEAALGDRQAPAIYGERMTRMVLVFAAPAAVMLGILSEPLTQLLFERGAFTHTTTLGVASVLPGMFAGMVPMLGVVMLFKALYARNDSTGAAWISVAGVALYFAASGLLSRLVGLQGIVAAYLLSWIVMLALSLARVTAGTRRTILTARNARFLARLGASLAASAAVTWTAGRLWITPGHPTGAFTLAASLALPAAAGALTYLGAARGVFGIEEVGALSALLPARLRLGTAAADRLAEG